MELNTKGRYAVMAMTDLAKHGGKGAVSLAAIAERQQISLAYLEQIFQRLRRAGLVESARGRSGGYQLARAPGAIAIAEIMQAADEPVEMTRCAAHGLSGCVGSAKCLTHDLWRALGDHISAFLERVTLRDVIEGDPSRLAMPMDDPYETRRAREAAG
jgi:Rrf2 family protein